jgi:lysozyme
MSNNLSLSKAGLEQLIKHEGSINGLYDDPAHYATYGVGHLVHKSHKARSVLLASARSEKLCSDRVKTKWPGKAYETAYLEREAVACKDFERLKTAARDRALDIVALAKHKTAFTDLPREKQASVRVAADAAVAEEARLLSLAVADVLAQDVRPFEKSVNEAVTNVALVQDEFDALVSFTFNVGEAAFKRSNLLKKINENTYRAGKAGDHRTAIEAIEQAFLAWNTAGGKVLDGLTKRRQAESDLFLKAARRELQSMTGSPAQPAAVPVVR